MTSKVNGIKLADAIIFNPRESIPKGHIAKKVAMDRLRPFTRDIPGYELASYEGGSKFRNGDTIMARITPCLENGKTSMVNILDAGEVGFGSTEYIVMRAKEGITDPDFVYYLACSPIVRDSAIKSMVGSSGRQRVQQDVLNNLIVDIPSLQEQKQIAYILRCIDDKIYKNVMVNDNFCPHSLTLDTSSSPDMRRGRSVSRSSTSLRDCLSFSCIAIYIGVIIVSNCSSTSVVGIIISIALRMSVVILGTADPAFIEARSIPFMT